MASLVEHRLSGRASLRGRSVGAAVLGIAGTCWCWSPVAALPIPAVLSRMVLFMIALALYAAAFASIRAYRGPAVPVDRRLMAVSIVAEAAAIAVGTGIVAGAGRPDLVLPVVGLAVGLHFLPMARALSYPPYRILGLAIIAFALVPMALPGPAGLAILGAGIGGSLFLALLHMVFHLRTRRRTDCLTTGTACRPIVP